MKRHRTDLIALLFGLAFLGVAATFFVHEATDRHIEPAWVGAIGFVALGVTALAVTLGRHGTTAEPMRRSGTEDVP